MIRRVVLMLLAAYAVGIVTGMSMAFRLPWWAFYCMTPVSMAVGWRLGVWAAERERETAWIEGEKAIRDYLRKRHQDA